ncbi:MAG: MFS transporter [Natronomonas sp.]
MSRSPLFGLWNDPQKRRWFAFFALASTYVLMSVYRLSTAVLAEELTRAFSVTGTQLGNLHAAFFYIYAAMQLPAGVLVDRLGARRTVTGGALLMSIGGFVFAGTSTYPIAFAGRVLIGLGGGILFLAILRFCANWFRPSEFARMSGLTIALSGFGGVLATTPLAIVVAMTGWRRTLAAISVLAVVLAVVAYAVSRDTPVEAGFEPVSGVDSPGVSSLRAIVSNAGTVLREAETWLCGVVLFGGTGINITVFGLWGIPYLVQTYGFSVTTASTYTLLGSAGLVMGPPVVGYLSDRFASGPDGEVSPSGRTRLIVVGMLLYTIGLAVLAVTGAPPPAVVAVIFFGTGALAGAFVLSYAIVKERHDAAASGVSTGAVNMMAFGGAAVLPTAMGYALDTYWTGETIGGTRVYTEFGYQVAFGLAAAVAFASLIAAVWLHVRATR